MYSILRIFRIKINIHTLRLGGKKRFICTECKSILNSNIIANLKPKSKVVDQELRWLLLASPVEANKSEE
jgi:hypothetical protein